MPWAMMAAGFAVSIISRQIGSLALTASFHFRSLSPKAPSAFQGVIAALGISRLTSKNLVNAAVGSGLCISNRPVFAGPEFPGSCRRINIPPGNSECPSAIKGIWQRRLRACLLIISLSLSRIAPSRCRAIWISRGTEIPRIANPKANRILLLAYSAEDPTGVRRRKSTKGSIEGFRLLRRQDKSSGDLGW